MMRKTSSTWSRSSALGLEKATGSSWRKSTDEAKDGETIGAQLGAVLQYCDAAGHNPRIVLAVLNLSGRTEFEDRHDFTEVFESFRRGEVSWVAYRGMDRLGRSMPSTTQFVHWLQRCGIGLHIAQLHKEVDLHNPFEVSLLWTLASGAELESAMSGERLLTALDSQMRDAGGRSRASAVPPLPSGASRTARARGSCSTATRPR